MERFPTHTSEGRRKKRTGSHLSLFLFLLPVVHGVHHMRSKRFVLTTCSLRLPLLPRLHLPHPCLVCLPLPFAEHLGLLLLQVFFHGEKAWGLHTYEVATKDLLGEAVFFLFGRFAVVSVVVWRLASISRPRSDGIEGRQGGAPSVGHPANAGAHDVVHVRPSPFRRTVGAQRCE